MKSVVAGRPVIEFPAWSKWAAGRGAEITKKELKEFKAGLGEMKLPSSCFRYVNADGRELVDPGAPCDVEFERALAKSQELWKWLVGGDALGDFMSQAVENDAIRVEDIFGDEDGAVCKKSLSLCGSNFLEFSSGRGLFYIAQVRCAVDAIIIPRYGVVIGRGLSSIRRICFSFMDRLARRLVALVGSGISPPGEPVFLGGVVNQALPYHYFYDAWPGFYWLLEKHPDVLRRSPLVGFPGGYYLPLHELFSLPSRQVRLDAVGCSELLAPEGGFYLAIYRNERHQRKRLLEKADKALLEAVDRLLRNQAEAETGEVAKRLNGCDPYPVRYLSGVEQVRDGDDIAQTESAFRRGLRYVLGGRRKRADVAAASGKVLWFGLLAGKRNWVDQVTAISGIIMELERTEREPLYVFDGMTSDEMTDVPAVGEPHQQIFHDIMERTGLPLERVVNLNGARPLEKLAWAMRTDFFLADAATSSMYVSRFAGAPGLCHSSPDARVTGHRHKGNVRHIDAELVTALGEEGDWQFRDYSIDPAVVKKLFFDGLYKYK